jgi:hypothetical protein
MSLRGGDPAPRDDKAPRSERLPDAIFDSTTTKPSLLMNRAKRRVIGAILQFAFAANFCMDRSVSADNLAQDFGQYL